MALAPKRVVLGLVTVQVADAVFSAIPTQWLKDDLEHLGFPYRLRFVFPVIKGGSAVGLLAGLRRPPLGRLTATVLVAYFIAAIGFHVRAKDTLVRHVPAAAMLAWSLLAARAYRVEDSARS
ncbi:MAG TPA: DoxX family protein [Acidimicrobiales bacterium]|nr:DoxX family protein [Acidimicrobiales bacterium]